MRGRSGPATWVDDDSRVHARSAPAAGRPPLGARAPRWRRCWPLRAVCAALVAIATVTLASSPANASVAERDLPCLTDAAVAQVRAAPEQAFPALAAQCRDQLRDRLGEPFADLDDEALTFVFATLVAYRSASYGPSTQYDLKYLSSRWALDCAGYAALTWHLARLAGADVRYTRIVGWDGGGVGNHAQITYDRPGQELILDPTVGLIARAAFDNVINGAPTPATGMVSFPKPEDRSLDEFRGMIIDSLYVGMFRPPDSTYVHPYPPGRGATYQAALEGRWTTPTQPSTADGAAAPVDDVDQAEPDDAAGEHIGAPAPPAPPVARCQRLRLTARGATIGRTRVCVTVGTGRARFVITGSTSRTGSVRHCVAVTRTDGQRDRSRCRTAVKANGRRGVPGRLAASRFTLTVAEHDVAVSVRSSATLRNGQRATTKRSRSYVLSS